MTLQQMEYLVALYQTRHFGQAAEMCHVTQPSLSAQIQKIEEELDISLFERAKRGPIVPTMLCHNVVHQAQLALAAAKKINEVAAAESAVLGGELRLGVIPTIAPYIIPKLVRNFGRDCPSVTLTVTEGRTNNLVRDLREGKLDIVLCATPLEQEELLEIPIYYERFVAYFSPKTPLAAAEAPHNLEGLDELLGLNHDGPLSTGLWVLQEGHCMRSQMFNFCGKQHPYNTVFEAGTIDTLVRIIDENGGYSLIPEQHVEFLTERQKGGVRPIEGNPAVREVSLVVRTDFVRERLINALADALKQVIPPDMLNERLRKFAIKL